MNSIGEIPNFIKASRVMDSEQILSTIRPKMGGLCFYIAPLDNNWFTCAIDNHDEIVLIDKEHEHVPCTRRALLTHFTEAFKHTPVQKGLLFTKPLGAPTDEFISQITEIADLLKVAPGQHFRGVSAFHAVAEHLSCYPEFRIPQDTFDPYDL